MADTVNHPKHYGGEENPYEVIKVAEAWGFDEDAYLFNALKYLGRAGKKGNTAEDLQKAVFYLKRKLRRLETAEILSDSEAVAAINEGSGTMPEVENCWPPGSYITVRYQPDANNIKQWSEYMSGDEQIGPIAVSAACHLGAEVFSAVTLRLPESKPLDPRSLLKHVAAPGHVFYLVTD
jgi:Protein of unknwon function (DUF3310)